VSGALQGHGLMDNELEMLTVKDVAETLKMGERTIWRLVSSGRFPPPVRIGASARWRKSRIQQWLHEQEAAGKRT